jgi:hypothetical protein
MKRYTVQLARIEHRIYQLEVEAVDAAEAEQLAEETWADNDEEFTDLGCVHAEEFIHEIQEQKEAA